MFQSLSAAKEQARLNLDKPEEPLLPIDSLVGYGLTYPELRNIKRIFKKKFNDPLLKVSEEKWKHGQDLEALRPPSEEILFEKKVIFPSNSIAVFDFGTRSLRQSLVKFLRLLGYHTLSVPDSEMSENIFSGTPFQKAPSNCLLHPHLFENVDYYLENFDSLVLFSDEEEWIKDRMTITPRQLNRMSLVEKISRVSAYSSYIPTFSELQHSRTRWLSRLKYVPTFTEKDTIWTLIEKLEEHREILVTDPELI
jgi:hypothetical protein